MTIVVEIGLLILQTFLSDWALIYTQKKSIEMDLELLVLQITFRVGTKVIYFSMIRG